MSCGDELKLHICFLLKEEATEIKEICNLVGVLALYSGWENK